MEPRSPTIFLPVHNAEARLGPALEEVRWLAGGRRGSAGTVVAAGEVTGRAVLLPSLLVGGTGLVDASA
jgi:hypothetical protein